MDNIDLQVYQEKIIKNMPVGENEVSTLLIPKDLMKKFKYQQKKFRGKPEYFSHLIMRYRNVLRTFAFEPSGLRTEYQFKHQNLQKVNFRPQAADWAELGTFSIATGKSRCFLFVLLLLMDLHKWDAVQTMAGIVMNDPFAPEHQWELLGVFGVERTSLECIRGLIPRLKQKNDGTKKEEEKTLHTG